jgi:hypothetical protein
MEKHIRNLVLGYTSLVRSGAILDITEYGVLPLIIARGFVLWLFVTPCFPCG